MTLVKIGTGSRIPQPEGFFEYRFRSISLPLIKLFSRNFGEYVGNKLPQGVKWSKHVSFGNPIWQTAAMQHACKISEFWEHISGSEQNIFTKFCGYVDSGLRKCVENGLNTIASKIQLEFIRCNLLEWL